MRTLNELKNTNLRVAEVSGIEGFITVGVRLP
jgi:hypothetical protein